MPPERPQIRCDDCHRSVNALYCCQFCYIEVCGDCAQYHDVVSTEPIRVSPGPHEKEEK